LLTVNPFNSLIEIVIPSSIEVFGKSCFTQCRLLSSIAFESKSESELESKVSRIDNWAFRNTGLIEIAIPASVKLFMHELLTEYRLL
jgi:hypothetical protein